ncbi:MAG: hypothetical protein M1837_005785 [Sclerophora amabilis]|nr:MAG: hypothetical protein M1837_005785 [Sclerophora amabilis]
MGKSSTTDLQRLSRQLQSVPKRNGARTALSSNDSGHGDDKEIICHLNQVAQADFHSVVKSPFARLLLGHEQNDDLDQPHDGEETNFANYIPQRLALLMGMETIRLPGDFSIDHSSCLQYLFLIGYAALHAFLQSNATGPPLPFTSEHLVLSSSQSATSSNFEETRQKILFSLGVDGVAPYALIPNVELFFLAKIIFNHQNLALEGAIRQRLHVNFLHQRLLTEEVSSLQSIIYDDLEKLDADIISNPDRFSTDEVTEYLLEKAAIHTYYGADAKAREDLDKAAHKSHFEFALTGRLGKRTKFQQTDISQLVVLAQSASEEAAGKDDVDQTLTPNVEDNQVNGSAREKPENLDLNDDTLLESISFSKSQSSILTTIQDDSSLPPRLASLEAGNQPALRPLDSIILLSLASSITNTSPSHGLTREETLPYATRVLEGGSTNWQVYTQALLVRSRIEGYKSRTQERGVLQLQALVDQVIAETTPDRFRVSGSSLQNSTSTFLPRAKPAEAASATERLRYIHQLSSPTRWELEGELAARWISLGGLKTALEIYERLQMWAEVALCWAGLEEEKKARRVIRKQLFHSSSGDDNQVNEDEEAWGGQPRRPAPPDVSRFYCILGDIDSDPKMYESAWEESNGRYSRAQRSLGKHYFSAREFAKSAEAYAKSLKINQLNHGSWYALGCARLQLEQWDGAVEAFGRAVQLDEQDAESWSNLAAALLEKEATPKSVSKPLPDVAKGVEASAVSMDPPDPYGHKKDALKALKHAARLKRDDWRIWENLLIVSASIAPPPYSEVVIAIRRIIQIRGPSIGEKCIDEDVLDLLVRHIINVDAESDEPSGYDPAKPGLERMVVELVDKDVLPLITRSRRLWQIVARLNLWRKRPTSALEANEKAWRATISQPGWETGSEKRWDDIVDATIELVDAYESLGGMQRTEGLGAGDGQLVAKDWRFKARNAVRGIMGRGKESWEGTDGWDRLKERMEELKGTG